MPPGIGYGRNMFRTLPQRVGQDYGAFGTLPQRGPSQATFSPLGRNVGPAIAPPPGSRSPAEGAIYRRNHPAVGTGGNPLPFTGFAMAAPGYNMAFDTRFNEQQGQSHDLRGTNMPGPYPMHHGPRQAAPSALPSQPPAQPFYNQPTQPSSGRFAATVTPQNGLRTGGIDPSLVDPVALRQYQHQTDLGRLSEGYENQSRQIGTFGFRYGTDGRPMMPAMTDGEQAMLNRQRQYDASSDPMGAMSSYDRFRPGGAFGSPAPAPQYQPTLLPNNTPVGGQTTIFNRADGRQVGLTANFRGTADDYQPIPTGDADVDRRRANAARAARQGTAYFGSRIVPREQNQGAPSGLPGYPDAVARSLSPEQRQQILQEGVNTRRNHFGLPSVPFANGGQQPFGQAPPRPTAEDGITRTQQVNEWFSQHPDATREDAVAAGFTPEEIDIAAAQTGNPNAGDIARNMPPGLFDIVTAGIGPAMRGLGQMGVGPFSESARLESDQKNKRRGRMRGDSVPTPPAPQPNGPSMGQVPPEALQWGPELLFPGFGGAFSRPFLNRR